MKKPFKVLSAAAMAAVVVVPSIVVPVQAAAATPAAATTPDQLVFTNDAGQQFLVSYEDYADFLFGEGNFVGVLEGKAPSAIGIDGKYVDYKKFQDILFEEGNAGLPTSDLLDKAVKDESNLVDKETSDSYVDVTFDKDGKPVYGEPEPTEVEVALEKATTAVTALPNVDDVKATDEAAVTAAAKLVADAKALGADVTALEAKVTALQAKIAEMTAVVSVESVKAINAKTLEVTFNKELTVDEQKALAFEVKKDGSTQLIKVDSFEGKTAKITRTNGANFTAGEYAVTVKGLSEDVTVKTTVAAQKATSLDISNDQLLDATPKAKLGVELTDQYGEKLALAKADYTVSAFNKTQNVAIAGTKVDFDPTTKTFYINTLGDNQTADKDAFKVGDEVTVTFLHNATGLTATKTLKVVAGAQLDSITVGDVQLPEGKELLTQDLKDIKVSYTAKDQYGNAVDLNDKASDIEVISTTPSVVAKGDVSFVKDGDKTLINIKEFGDAGKTNIIILNKITGETSTLALEVNEKAGVPYAVTLGETSTEVAGNGGTKAIDLTVTDKYGNKVAPKDYVGATFTIVSSNTDVITTPTIQGDASLPNYGKLIITSTGNKGDKATATITLNSTGQSAKVDVTVGETATPFNVAVSKDSKHSTSLVPGAKTTIDFDVFDQFNTAYTAASGNYKVVYSLKEEKAGDVLAITSPTQQDTVNAASVEVTAKTTGTATLVAKLINTDKPSEVLDQVEVGFSVVANTSDNLTYSLDEIPVLYRNGVGSDTTFDEGNLADPSTNEGSYAKPINIIATDAKGNKVALDSSNILSVSSSNGKVGVDADANGDWYVFGTLTNAEANALTTDITSDITVVYNASGTPKTLTKKVTVSKDERKASEIKFVDKALTNAGFANAKTKAEITLTASEVTNASTYNLATKDVFVAVKDQFGGYTLADATTDYANGSYQLKVVAANNVSGVTDNTVTVTGAKGVVQLGTVVDTDLNDTIGENGAFNIIAIADGVTNTLKVNVDSAAYAKKALEEIKAVSAAPASLKVSAADLKAALTTNADKVNVDNLVAYQTELAKGTNSDAPTVLAKIVAVNNVADALSKVKTEYTGATTAAVKTAVEADLGTELAGKVTVSVSGDTTSTVVTVTDNTTSSVSSSKTVKSGIPA
ncbi:hypothetical protein [Sporosarcina ureae]|uniref:hypothetical protein n=1 Tax=Sporosarcina ureae TaxID=1571 RepID=UPI0026F1DB9C|nr:hypothetical protein [Sporosarcina ureae]